MHEEPEDWVTAVGVLVVVCLITTLGLVAAGGWSWFAKFLESAAANWVQAIGSIAAILAAGRFVKVQIRANQEALVASQKNAEAMESERRRTRRRELLLAMEDQCTSAIFAVRQIPVTAETSNAHAWRTVEFEVQRIREDMSRVQGAEALGMGLLKELGMASFTLHQATVLANVAAASPKPDPLPEVAKALFIERLQRFQNKLRNALFLTSTQEELKSDMDSISENIEIHQAAKQSKPA